MTRRAAAHSHLTIRLEEGTAEIMGEGLLVILQRDPTTRKRNNVVIARPELAAMEAVQGLTTPIEDGASEYMGDDLWVLIQADRTSGRTENVVVSRQDVQRMLLAA